MPDELRPASLVRTVLRNAVPLSGKSRFTPLTSSLGLDVRPCCKIELASAPAPSSTVTSRPSYELQMPSFSISRCFSSQEWSAIDCNVTRRNSLVTLSLAPIYSTYATRRNRAWSAYVTTRPFGIDYLSCLRQPTTHAQNNSVSRKKC